MQQKRNVLTPRNRLGQFCLSKTVDQIFYRKPIEGRVDNNSTNNKFPETPPDIGDEWETINLNESDRKNYRNKK